MQPAQQPPPDSPAGASGRPGGPGKRLRRPRLVCLGDATVDIVIARRAGLAVGSDVDGAVSFRLGGSAANTARAFAALGGDAHFVGAVGDDGWGRRLAAALRAARVSVHAPRLRGTTARLAVLLGERGERSFITDRGAADGLRPSHLRASWFTRADALHLPAYSLLNEPLASAAATAIGHAQRAARLVSIDLASRKPLLAGGRAAARALIARVGADVLLANADEARALVGGDDERLVQLAPVAVIKEGAAGCRVLWRAGTGVAAGPAAGRAVSCATSHAAGDVRQLAIATTPLATTDTTGAGDAFDAGFLHALLSGQLRAPGPALADAGTLRRAAAAGHRAAAAWLRGPRLTLEA